MNPANESLVRRSLERSARMVEVDDELRRLLPSPEAVAKIQSAKTSVEVVASAFELNADRPCLGYRVLEGASPEGAAFQTLSYAEVWARVEAFASGLAHAKLGEPGELSGISGFASVDWVVAELACHRRGITTVPLQTRMVPSDLQQILRETEPRTLVLGVGELDSIEAALPRCPSVRHLILMDVREGDTGALERVAVRKRAIEDKLGGRVAVHTMLEVEELGRAKGVVPAVLPSALPGLDPLMTLVYTSGSTGTPKGAMFPESLWLRHWQARSFWRGVPDVPFVTVDYMPLNHAAGRFQLMSSIAHGGTTYFVSKSDMSTLFEDIRLARPTSLLLVPRVAGMIHQRFQAELIRRSAGLDPAAAETVERELLEEMGNGFLGDRLLFVTTGSAPTPPEVTSFLKRCFEVPVFDGYGSTEAGPVTFEGRVDPAHGITWKLVDVPEADIARPISPIREGELHVHSKFLIPGYYRNERATKERFDDEGFMNTGDIVEQRGPDCLVWIDRAKNVLKLSQGEYVATSRLEGLYGSGSPFIQQIHLHGNGLRAYLLAVVVPANQAVRARLGESADDEAQVVRLVREELKRIAADEGLHGYEIPRDFLLEREPFTTENGLLTASKKPSRPKLRERYGERLEALYETIERARTAELEGLSAGAGALTTLEKVKKAVAATLGLPDVDAGQAARSFVELGGDSLSAVTLSGLLEELVGVPVPVGRLLDPTTSARERAHSIESELAGASPQRNATFEDVHGEGATRVRASDLTLGKFLGEAELEAAARSRPASELPAEAQVVLLTGANGFLGRFLALELLERLPAGGRLHCVVRAPSDDAALERLRDAYRADAALLERFEALAANGRLEVHAGDLTRSRFGLEAEVHARLAEEVDCVLHNGALVNHALTYPQLFEPNVLGTIEVLRFAFATRRKAVSYVSTVGAVSGLARGEPIREDEDIRALWPERRLGAGYAAGYATSKWASEILLRRAHDELGVPIAVFRPSGIMGHRVYRGQINVPDFFTRLLAGIVHTGLAPGSFYSGGPGHYDGLPVDVVARSIAAVSVERANAPGHATYHVVNPYADDGISLDTIVDWIAAAGYGIQRIPDHAAWYLAFRDRLATLGEPEKQHSPLAILSAWKEPSPGGRGAVFDVARLLERLRAIAAARGPEALATLPHVDFPAIRKYLDDMVTLRIVAPPPLRMTGS